MRFPNIFSAERRVNELEKILANSNFYAIRHKSTGRFLPHEHGGSYAEPTFPDIKPPRFFRRIGDAKGFLTIWLKGPLERTYTTNFEGEDYVTIEHNPKYAKEPRLREEYEVVTIYWGVKE